METFKTQYGVRQAAVHPNPNHSTLPLQRKRTQDWLHVKNTQKKRILVKSPDIDIYHIGLLLHHHQQKTIQVNKYNSNELQYLHLQALVAALENDPDLSALPKQLPQILQTMYVATRCDYTSSFSGVGELIPKGILPVPTVHK